MEVKELETTAGAIRASKVMILLISQVPSHRPWFRLSEGSVRFNHPPSDDAEQMLSLRQGVVARQAVSELLRGSYRERVHTWMYVGLVLRWLEDMCLKPEAVLTDFFDALEHDASERGSVLRGQLAYALRLAAYDALDKSDVRGSTLSYGAAASFVSALEAGYLQRLRSPRFALRVLPAFLDNLNPTDR